MEKQQKNKFIHWFIIGTFVSLYLMVSVISTIHVIDFFKLSNPDWLAVTLALAFEVGAAASLASIIVLDKMNKWIVWILFFLLTFMQAMGNTYFAFIHLKDYQGWIDLFGLNEEDPLYQKRILSIVSGAILPLVALGFIKSLVDYIKPDVEKGANETLAEIEEVKEEPKEEVKVDKKPLVDLESFFAAMEASKKLKEQEAQVQEPELITDVPAVSEEPTGEMMKILDEVQNNTLSEEPTTLNEVPEVQPEFIQVPVVENIEDIQPQKYAESYSSDYVKAEPELEEDG